MTDPDLRELPHTLDAERAVLGLILTDGATLRPARELLTAATFYRSPHRTLFAAMERLSERVIDIDPITVKEELLRTGELEAVGGPAYIASLLDGVPAASHIKHYARMIRESAVYRGLIQTAVHLQDAAFEQNGAVPGAMREVLEQIRKAEETLAPAVELPDMAALLAAPEAPAPTCIEGLAEFGAASLTSGPPGTWKTTIAAAMGLCVASGKPFGGRLETKQAPVLHIDAEMGERRLINLYRRVGLGEDIDPADLARKGFLHYLSATGSGPGRDPKAWERIVRERMIGFVILDPVVALFGGDENKSTEVRQWWENAIRPLLDLGAAVGVQHHDRKGSVLMPDSPTTSSRGSGDWRGAPDLHAVVRCEPGDHHLVRLEVTKSKLGPEPAPFCLRIEQEGARLRVRWVGEAQETIGKTVEARNAIVSMLEAAGPVGMLRQAVLKALAGKFAERTIEEALSLVRQSSKVTATSEGKQIRYRAALS